MGLDLVNLKDDMPVVDKYVQTWLDRVEGILDRAEGILTRLRDETEVEATVQFRKRDQGIQIENIEDRGPKP